MDERPAWDRSDDDDAPRGVDAPTEGVRIIGADEVEEHPDGAGSRRSEGMPRYGDRPPPPPDGPRPALRFPLTAAGRAGDDVVRPRVIGSPSMPHWTDPPSGEVPRILAGDDETGDANSDDDADLDVWSGLGATPRWRDAGPGGWDDGDDDDSLVHDEGTRIGALDDRDRPGPDDYFAFEDIEDGGVGGGEGGGGDTSGSADQWGDDGGDVAVAAESAPGSGGSVSSRAVGRRSGNGAPPGGGSGSGSGSRSTSTDRDLPTAMAVGVGVAVAAIVAMNLGPAFGVAFVAILVTLCAGELFNGLQKVGYQPATLLGLVATAALVLSAYWRGEAALPLVIALTVIFTLLWYLVGVTRISPTTNAGVTLLAVFYIGLFGSFAALMLRLPNGTGILLGTIIVVVANDVGALFVGRQFGKSPMAGAISPNKTLEGALGGAVAAVAVSFVVLQLIGLQPWEDKGGSALALGLLVAVLAPLGDLVESMIKRDLGVKDMGSVLPGHGGLIDRFDALLFVLPAAYYLTRLLEIV